MGTITVARALKPDLKIYGVQAGLAGPRTLTRERARTRVGVVLIGSNIDCATLTAVLADLPPDEPERRA